jgi:ATP-dependent DNA helicase RecG
MALSVDTPVQYIKGVGPKLGDLLKRKGIATIRDLVEFYPRAYEDRRAARSISSLQAEDYVGLRAVIAKVNRIPLGKTGRKIYDIAIKDDSGLIHCKFFRVPYKGYFDKFVPGMQVRVIGRVINYRNQLEFHHPELYEWREEDESQDEIVPVYSETEGLTSKKLQGMIKLALEGLGMPKEICEGLERLPEWLRKKYKLLSFSESVYNLHLPKMGQAESYLERRTPYHRRIIFDEFFLLEMVLAARKKGIQSFEAPVITLSADLENRFLKSLPFELTNGQKKVIEEIKTDLQKNVPMNRLVQGDVGSGKTMVAFVSSLHALQSGYQVALMAPTEILAQQHTNTAQRFFAPLGIKVELLSGQLKGAEKARVLEGIKSGEIHFIVGTHALIQEGVEFEDLGLVIVDEQHRFGVEQRGVLRGKGRSPHFLLMTATPIPRSLAMTIYGDLDVSAITEMPKGRQPIVTRATFQSKRPQVLKFMKDHLDKGRQAYIIFPLVEESEKIDLKSAINEYERLVAELPQYRVGLLHGRMKSEEKDEVMNRFRKHELDILVSTTVIEVGVDVPNANIMWIEHAERFGLSQLHQLRGRVGRGEHKSFCILMMGYANSPESVERVQFLETTNDGFRVAEFDLELRGPGEFLGVRQSGLPGFKMANLVKDLPILEEARKAAFELMDKDPRLMDRHHQNLKLQIHSKQISLS